VGSSVGLAVGGGSEGAEVGSVTVTVTEARTCVVEDLVAPVLPTRPLPLAFETTASRCSFGSAVGGTVMIEASVPRAVVRTEGIPASEPSHASWRFVRVGQPAPVTESEPPGTATPETLTVGSAALAAR